MAAAVLSEPISPGAQLGKYQIVHRIALGGMAEIYLARVVGIHGFEKFVVLKRILPQLAASEEFVQMFFREARVAAALDHANIAHVYDVGETRGVFFSTMEYLHGEDTRFIARELARDDQQIPIAQAVAVVIGVASGLHFAHEKRGADGELLGIVHRDISPSNIVVTYDGGVKIVDFGVAKISGDPELSQRYSLKGKLAYMSPEQLTGEVDRRSDVFSLGVVLYELTTGDRLFKAQTEAETVHAVLEAPVIKPSALVQGYPVELERIVMRAIDRDPARRYQTARELQIDLEAFARNRKLEVSSASLSEWMERRFGPKREIWYDLPLPPLEPDATPVVPSTEAETRVVSRSKLAIVVQQAADPSAELVDAPAARTRTAAPHARPGPGRLRAALVALTLIAAAGAALAYRRGPTLGRVSGTTAPPPPPRTVVVVAEKGAVALLPEPQKPGPPPPIVMPLQAPASRPRATARHDRRAVHPARAGRVGAGEAFSATLARHQSEIRRCFAEAGPDRPEGGEISLRFQAGRDGRVTSLTVLPEATAATPLGACLAKVGASTVFSPQREPMQFRIPLTVQAARGVESTP